MAAELIPVEQEEDPAAIVARAAQRRLVLMGEQQQLRSRYEEVMQWANPPWDPVSKRVNPRPERATPDRRSDQIHVDQVSQVLMRWSVLEMGELFDFRVEPEYVPQPVQEYNQDPQKTAADREIYNIDRLRTQAHAEGMENVTNEWIENANLHRTLLWAAWAKRAFGVAVLRTGWDDLADEPTCELLENPSQVYRGWTKLYGRRMLSWVNVAEAMSPDEANRRFSAGLPIASDGMVDWSSWGYASMEQGDLDQRPEQQGTVGAMIWVEEYWELQRERGRVMTSFIVAGKIVDGPHYYDWKRLPFRVVENEHIPTYQHSKSTAESMIPINAAYDDMLDRQHTVIEFESGPRYKGLNMYHSQDDVDVPAPFQMVPLREGEDIIQIDTRVDFFPTQLHANELKESTYDTTGLTPIAWGRSPNAQTSGRALSAEWRAVELPLHAALINWTPEILDILRDWWDFAEQYMAEAQRVGQGYRRFKLKWQPLDVRDASERTLDVIQRLNANLIDPETAIEELGYENSSEIMARIKVYLVDPVYNPLRYQQYLVLKQLSQQIEIQQMQLDAVKQQQGQQAQGQQQGQQQGQPSTSQPPPGAPQGQAAEYMNQPGQTPEGGGSPGGIPVETGILSRTPLEGGSGNQITATVGGAPGGGGIPVG